MRYGVSLMPYDLAWNVVAAVLLLAGIAWWVLIWLHHREDPTR
ncbi:hypothetical protein [Saccharopolyspora karakumensis]